MSLCETQKSSTVNIDFMVVIVVAAAATPFVVVYDATLYSLDKVPPLHSVFLSPFL